MTSASIDWYLENVVGANPANGAARRDRERRAWSDAVDRAALVPGAAAAVRIARRQGLVLTPRQAQLTGLCDADVRRLVRRGIWTAPRRGVLSVLPASGEDDEPSGRDPRIAATAAALARPGLVICHRSAALLHFLPLLGAADRPELTINRGNNGGGESDILVHAARFQPAEIDDWFGAPVLSPARTVVDIARGSGLRSGLVVADAALADGLVSYDDLVRALGRATRWPGVRTARRAVDLSCELAESPLESLARLLVIEAELPPFEPQRWIKTHRGWYRVDGLWPDRGVILEADGMGKYGQPVDLIAEKRRQEALERAGYIVVRVTWDDVLHDRAGTIRRIRDALRRGERVEVSRPTFGVE